MPVMGGGGTVISTTVAAGILPNAYVSTYLTNAGSNDMGVNGGAVNVPFTYTPPADMNLLEARIILYMESGANFGSENFMHLAALGNGVKISVGGIEITNWKDNIDIICDMFDLSNAGTAFSNERRSLAGRYTFTKGAAGEPLILFDGETVEALIRDNLSAAGIIFRIKMQGKLVAV